jgi:hypothetical protein
MINAKLDKQVLTSNQNLSFGGRVELGEVFLIPNDGYEFYTIPNAIYSEPFTAYLKKTKINNIMTYSYVISASIFRDPSRPPQPINGIVSFDGEAIKTTTTTAKPIITTTTTTTTATATTINPSIITTTTARPMTPTVNPFSRTTTTTLKPTISTVVTTITTTTNAPRPPRPSVGTYVAPTSSNNTIGSSYNLLPPIIANFEDPIFKVREDNKTNVSKNSLTPPKK